MTGARYQHFCDDPSLNKLGRATRSWNREEQLSPAAARREPGSETLSRFGVIDEQIYLVTPDLYFLSRTK